MAKEANVKLTLNASGFSQTIDSLKTKTRAFAADVKKNFGESFGAGAMGGLKAMSGSLRETGSMLKSHLATAATLGGAVGFGSMVRGAVTFREKMRDLEFQINKTGKATVSWKEMMDFVHRAADETGQSSENLANVVQNIFSQTGDAEFAITSIEAVGHAAQASGQDITKLGDAAAVLKRKFGATAETLPEMLAVFVEKSDAGGLSLDQLGNKFGLMAGEAADAGFKGRGGLSALLGMLTELDARVGEKAEPALKKMFQVLKNGSKDMKQFQREAGIKFTAEDDFSDKLHKILGSSKARKKFTEKLGGEQRVVFDELSKPFDAAFKQAKETGADTKQANKQGLDAFDAAMAGMAKSTMDFKKIVEESKQGQAEDPMAKLTKAIDKMAQAFQKPEMMEAIDKMTELLPELANGLVKVLNFVVKHPALSAGMFVGGKMAMAGASGFASSFTEKMVGKLKLEDKAADLFGKVGSKAFMESMEKHGGWAKVAGSFGAIAGTAILAYQAGTALIDEQLDEHFDSMHKLSDVEAEASSMMKHGVGSDVERKAAADALRNKITSMEKQEGPNVTTKFFGNAAYMIGATDSNPEGEWFAQLNRAKSVLAELEGQMKVKEQSDKFAQSLERANRAADKLSTTMEGVNAPGGGNGASRGPPRPGNPGTAAGHAPAG